MIKVLNLFFLAILFLSTNISYPVVKNTKNAVGNQKKNNKPAAKTPQKSVKTSNVQNNPAQQDRPVIPIGLIELDGELHDTFPMIMQLHMFMKEEKIKGILLKLHGGGNNLGYAYSLFEELREAHQKKPIVAWIYEDCTGACYYVASGAQHIVAAPTALVGQVGITMTIMRYNNTKIHSDHQTADATFDVFHKGDYKAVTHPYSAALSDEQKKYIESLLQTIYEKFCKDVAQSRNLKLGEQDQWGQGKIFIGENARTNKIVDTLGSYSAALRVMKHLIAKNAGEKIEGDMVLVAMQKNNENGKSDNKAA